MFEYWEEDIFKYLSNKLPKPFCTFAISLKASVGKLNGKVSKCQFIHVDKLFSE